MGNKRARKIALPAMFLEERMGFVEMLPLIPLDIVGTVAKIVAIWCSSPGVRQAQLRLSFNPIRNQIFQPNRARQRARREQ